MVFTNGGKDNTFAASRGDGDGFVYKTADELALVADDELDSLSGAIPTEYADLLRWRYAAILKQKGVTTDVQELQVIEEYLVKYKYEGLVPVGRGWVKVSPAKRDQFAADHEADDSDTLLSSESAGAVPPILVVAAVVFGVLLILFLAFRNLSNDESEMVLLPTATPTMTPTATIIPTVTPTPTATPIALVDSDRFIRAGEQSNRTFYPVFLQVALPDGSQPRVFVIQQRLVDTTEWRYETNPDVASWISGMVVRPVVGIPYAAGNAELMNTLGAGTVFTLRMNTGQQLTFNYRETRRVGREDTSLFRQNEPALVVVLIGETDETGLPTATRLLVLADYVAAQEMQSLEVSSALPAAPGQVVRVGDLSLQVTGADMLPVSHDATAQFVYGVVDVVLSIAPDAAADVQSVSLAGYQWFIEDGEGARYSPEPAVDSLSTFGALPASLARGQAVPASVGFLISRYTADARLLVAPQGANFQPFAIAFDGLPLPPSVQYLDVQIRAIRRDSRHVYVEARFYNPQESEVVVTPADVWMVLGFVPDSPSGSRQTPHEWEGMRLASGQALDALMTFDWNGRDPYAYLHIAGRELGITLMEP